MESSEAVKKLETAEAHKNKGNDHFKSFFFFISSSETFK